MSHRTRTRLAVVSRVATHAPPTETEPPAVQAGDVITSLAVPGGKVVGRSVPSGSRAGDTFELVARLVLTI